MPAEVTIDGESLTPAEVKTVARDETSVTVPESGRERVRESRARTAEIVASGEAVYGVNTGFGDLVGERIPPTDIEPLQRNLLRSHAAGTGRELTTAEVRATLVTRLNALGKGYSGVRERVVDLPAAMLNERVHPIVPTEGRLAPAATQRHSPTSRS